MQVLLSVIHDSPELATGAEMAAIDEFNDQLIAQGHWIFAGGLGSSTGVVDNRGPETIVTDGPFLESKEYLAGFYILEVADERTALALATRASRACNRKIEVRPFM